MLENTPPAAAPAVGISPPLHGNTPVASPGAGRVQVQGTCVGFAFGPAGFGHSGTYGSPASPGSTSCSQFAGSWVGENASSLVCEFSLCLSRACRGNILMFVLSSKTWERRRPFSYLLVHDIARDFLPARVARGRCKHLHRVADHLRENGSFEPFIYKNDHFAKTGSGQT